MARFRREARLLASLNHPNIATIYGLEDSGGVHYLVLELVEGETLAERIGAGPVPVEEALQIAAQMAEGLEHAHGERIIHRDLKPANVKVTPEGRVKLLDFGLAKAFHDEQQDLSDAVTLSAALTEVGRILGTPAYMSPEQAQGKPVSQQTDIWAFGCVLYEMLTGRRAFPGETVTETIAAVLRSEPDWQKLPTETPPAIRTLLRRCLQKDVIRRKRDIGDARIEIEEAISTPGDVLPTSVAVSSTTMWRKVLPWAVAVIAILIAVALAVPYFQDSSEESQTIQFSITAPASTNETGDLFSVSPDGTQVAFVAANPAGQIVLWVRSLESAEAQLLPGTEGAAVPFGPRIAAPSALLRREGSRRSPLPAESSKRWRSMPSMVGRPGTGMG